MRRREGRRGEKGEEGIEEKGREGKGEGGRGDREKAFAERGRIEGRNQTSDKENQT